MKAAIFLVICSVCTVYGQLIYSPSYANVYLQQPDSQLTSLTLKQQHQAYSEVEDLQDNDSNNNNSESTTENDDDGPETTTEPESEQVRLTRPERLTEQSAAEKGIYYIYHPNGLLQKVVYATKQDTENMAYFAQVNYENVEPILEPIYTYDPNTFVLQRIQVQ